VDGADRVESVTLLDGEVLPADLVLVATGSAPNSGWLQSCGIKLDRGAVVCDRYAFVVARDGTALEGVVAAGDIAAWPSPYGGTVCVEHWSNARDMAEVAVANLLSPPAMRRPLELVPTFWSDQYHVKIKSAGF